MRVRLGLVVALTATMIVLPAQTAAADGGSYFDFQQRSRAGSHFLPGDTASGTAFVSIPDRRQGLLERGPFYMFLVPSRQAVQEGRPLPEGTITLDAATIEHDSRTVFRITTSFTVPNVPGDLYTIRFCNNPCTISGFRESLYGQISIVQTLREASLLNEQQRLFGKIWNLRRQLRKADRGTEELVSNIDAANAERDALAERIDELESEIVSAEQASVEEGRPLVDAWALVTVGIAVVVALTSIVLALVFARRRRPDERFVVPDTIAELDEERTGTLTRT